MKTWLKGGLIGLIVATLLTLIVYLYPIPLITEIFNIFFLWPANSISNFMVYPLGEGGLIMAIMAASFSLPVIGFIYGAAIGLLYQKLKDMEKAKETNT